MAKILFLVPHLQYGSATTQIAQLAGCLSNHRLCVASIDGDGPASSALRRAGVTIASLGQGKARGLGAWARLRALLKEDDPAVVHAVGTPALALYRLAAGRSGRPVVVSQPGVATATGLRLGRLDRWLLRRADRVIVAGAAEREACCAAGIDDARIAVVPPAVAVPREWQSDASDHGERRDDVINIVAPGPVDRCKGHFEAIWAFDVLRHYLGAMRLIVPGEGSELPRLQTFIRDIDLREHVHFPGPCADLAAYLAPATAAWLPTRVGRGRHALLEAMARGVPVIASRLPALAEIVPDGRAGFLVPPGDKVAFARKTRTLVEDPARRDDMGAAGREHVQRNFPIANMTSAYLGALERLAA